MKQQMVYKRLMTCFLLLTQFYCTFFTDKVLLYLFISSHSSVNKRAAFFLYSHLQLLGFQTNSLSHFLLTEHSHLHLSLFCFCLLLRIIGSNLHSHLQLSCHFIRFVLFFHDIRSNTFKVMFFDNIWNTYSRIWVGVLLQFPLHLFTLILNG